MSRSSVSLLTHNDFIARSSTEKNRAHKETYKEWTLKERWASWQRPCNARIEGYSPREKTEKGTRMESEEGRQKSSQESSMAPAEENRNAKERNLFQTCEVSKERETERQKGGWRG